MDRQQIEQGAIGVYSAPWIRPVRLVALTAFLIALAWAILHLFSGARDHSFQFLFVLIAATLMTLTSLMRTLPLQNVTVSFLLASVPVILAEYFGESFSFSVAVPGCVARGHPRLEYGIVALIWIVALFSSRGVSRLLLHRIRNTGIHGVRVIGLTSLLVTVFDLCMQAGASAGGVASNSIRPTHVMLWGALAVVTQIVLTPWLLHKKPAPQTSDWHPAIIWISLIVLFASATLAQFRPL